MQIEAKSTIKFGGVHHVPGTETAVFECPNDIAKDLVDRGLAVRPAKAEAAASDSKKESGSKGDEKK